MTGEYQNHYKQIFKTNYCHVTKKTLPILCIYLLLPFFKSNAQSSPFADKLGVSADELAYKECPFDKEATAVVFVDEAVSDYNEQYNLVTYHHVKLKILKDKGVEYGNVEIPFYREDDFENIYSVEGTIYNNGNVLSSRKLDKKSVYTQKENKYWGEVKFAFPEVKAAA